MKISVYITSYNQKAFLKEAIESVLNQTFQPFEIIIVDDHSSDGSQDLIKYFASKYENVRYVLHEKNKGVSQVRITALNEIRGDYVTYLDGDDLYLPNKLKIESDIICNEDSDVAFSNNMYVDEKNTDDVRWIWASNKMNIQNDLFLKTLSRDFPRKSLFRMELINYRKLKKIGFHDPNLDIYEDYDLRIRLAKKLKFGYSLEPTTKIRISTNGLSKLSKIEHRKALNYIYNKYSSDIDKLDDESKKDLKQKFEAFIEKYSGDQKPKITLSFKDRFKNRLIRTIKSF